jgi:hypothetical protein
MPATFTKSFPFAASYTKAGKVHGHNYRLHLTFSVLSESEETTFIQKTEASLIQKISSKDFGDVDFLKTVEITDLNLLSAFWKILQESLKPAALLALTLERDEWTRTTLTPDKR